MSLDAFLPQARSVSVGGRTLSILPLRVKQIPAFAKAIAPAMSRIASGDIIGAVAEHGEQIIDAVSIATGAERDFVEALEADAFLELASVVMEVNADFFARRVLPALEKMSETMVRTLGAQPSPSSSQPASASATSSS
jgi:hypothetical protein